MGMTFYSQIRIPFDYQEMSELDYAAMLFHELRHLRQWRKYGRFQFGARYILQPRWRWAMEMQAFRSSVMMRDRLGDKMLREYISRLPITFITTYALRSIRWEDLESQTIKILRSEM